DGSKGAIIPAEVVWTPKLGEQKLPGEYRAGYYYSTADAIIFDGVTPQDEQTQNGHHHGGWIVAKQQLTSHQGDTSRGLSSFVN
ncbi:carbohydrate porin, partial [Acinetobacter baumannii]|uniref:carbohydrate porin n=1 Tax=Acinetobacter baumannii TaxID=470 RepID=UPI0030F6A660